MRLHIIIAWGTLGDMIERPSQEKREVESLSSEEKVKYLLLCANALENPIFKSFLLGLARDEIKKLTPSKKVTALATRYEEELSILSKNRFP